MRGCRVLLRLDGLRIMSRLFLRQPGGSGDERSFARGSFLLKTGAFRAGSSKADRWFLGMSKLI